MVPDSEQGARPEVVEYISSEIQPATILDVGPGVGTYSDSIKRVWRPERFDAIEIFPRYVSQYRLNRKYNNVFIGDMLEWEDYNYDLVIFGDVIEHVYKEQAVELWGRVSEQARWAIIACPIDYWPQGPMFGNDHEAHLHHYSVEEIHETFGVPVWEKEVGRVASFVFRFEDGE